MPTKKDLQDLLQKLKAKPEAELTPADLEEIKNLEQQIKELEAAEKAKATAVAQESKKPVIKLSDELKKAKIPKEAEQAFAKAAEKAKATEITILAFSKGEDGYTIVYETLTDCRKVTVK